MMRGIQFERVFCVGVYCEYMKQSSVVGLGVLAVVVVAAVGFVISRQRPARVVPTPQHHPTSSSMLEESPLPAVTTSRVLVGMKQETVSLENGRMLRLSYPQGYDLSVAAQGQKKLRFMAQSPDRRLFVGEMESASDSSNGRVLIFEDFDPAAKTFKGVTTYLSKLRNPHSLAFYTDREGKTWLYVALTDKLIRYAYQNGDREARGEPQTIAAFADYGRSWADGGWHLTRTVVVHDHRLYVSVGSSCNACEEKTNEPERATILVMNPDGSDRKTFASGLRNAVGMVFVGDELYATANSSDHLGDDRPQDTLLRILEDVHHGWPYCYQLGNTILKDDTEAWERSFSCDRVPLAVYAFDPHTAPLGIEVMDNRFLVALHGSGDKKLGYGYEVLLVTKDGVSSTPFLTGFLRDGVVMGRPAGVLAHDERSVFITDDYNGAIYYLERQP